MGHVRAVVRGGRKIDPGGTHVLRDVTWGSGAPANMGAVPLVFGTVRGQGARRVLG